MVKKHKVEEEQLEENEEEGKERKPKESVEKRKRLKREDKAARWSGMILLVTLLIVGFLLWITGEVRKQLGSEPVSPTPPRVIVE